ncbi:hypothetical protein [Cohnella lupini]|uniref:hypothetical protein n=1 Tax=Cohnella lupini TaxID=1294267 RepID=UPI000E2754D5|nr:hypothetical protein [Cohnella lupini]
MSYICPVCGLDELRMQPYDEKGNESFEICKCCGFEFGVDDLLYTFETYRVEWITNGAKWFMGNNYDWNLKEQLKNIEKIKPMYIPFHCPRLS